MTIAKSWPPELHGELKRSGDTWFIWTTPDLLIKLKRWFPRVQPDRSGALVIKATAEVSRDIEWFMTRYPFQVKGPTLKKLTDEAQSHRDLEVEALDILAGKETRQLDHEVPLARDYQLTAADLALLTGHLMIGDDIGLGKTLECLLILRDSGLLPCLIVCQTHLPDQWAEEIDDFLPWLTPHVAKKGSPYKLAKYHDGRSPDVLIMGYSKISGWAPALKGKIKSVILDECQEVRIAGSQKYIGCAQVADEALCVVGATATPVYNYGDEVFNIFDIIKKGCLGSREEFLREWGKRMGNHWGVRDPVALRQYLIGQNLMIQRTRKEVGRELPAAIAEIETVESDEAKFTEMMAAHGATAEILAKREASRQELFTLSGQFEWQLREATGAAKAPFVAAAVRGILSSEKKVVMFGWHHKVYDIWRQELAEFNPVFYGGQQTPAKKAESKGAFLNDPECRVMVISLRSGAGLDGLQEVCRVAVFGELDWSPTLHQQCIGRLRRDGMTDPVIAYFLVSQYGSDPFVGEKLQLKRGQSIPFMDPEAELLELNDEEATSGRSFRMAEEFLARHG